MKKSLKIGKIFLLFCLIILKTFASETENQVNHCLKLKDIDYCKNVDINNIKSKFELYCIEYNQEKSNINDCLVFFPIEVRDIDSSEIIKLSGIDCSKSENIDSAECDSFCSAFPSVTECVNGCKNNPDSDNIRHCITEKCKSNPDANGCQVCNAITLDSSSTDKEKEDNGYANWSQIGIGKTGIKGTCIEGYAYLEPNLPPTRDCNNTGDIDNPQPVWGAVSNGCVKGCNIYDKDSKDNNILVSTLNDVGIDWKICNDNSCSSTTNISDIKTIGHNNKLIATGCTTGYISEDNNYPIAICENGNWKIESLGNCSIASGCAEFAAGSQYQFDVKNYINLKIQLWGGKGGGSTGGKGGYSYGEINKPYEEKNISNLYVTVGGRGKLATGGYNGGGNQNNSGSYCSNLGHTSKSYGGGGSTDIRYGSSDLNNRILVAGGGGGASAKLDAGGYGAGISNSSGMNGGDGGGRDIGFGGKINEGGAGAITYGATSGTLLNGGNGGQTSERRFCGGAGGGGYYGGGGGSYGHGEPAGGGGGSSFVNADYFDNLNGSNNIASYEGFARVCWGDNTACSGSANDTYKPNSSCTKYGEAVLSDKTCNPNSLNTESNILNTYSLGNYYDGYDGYDYRKRLTFASWSTATSINSGESLTGTCKSGYTTYNNYNSNPIVKCYDGNFEFVSGGCRAKGNISYTTPAAYKFFLADNNILPGDRLYFDLYGASGASSDKYSGKGGRTTGYYTIKGESYICAYVGGSSDNVSANYDVGGYNGGANGGNGNQSITKAGKGNGGGGATDIRTVCGTWAGEESLKSRILVAGGGGGAPVSGDSTHAGGNGGGGNKNGTNGTGAYGGFGGGYSQQTGTGNSGSYQTTIGSFGKGGTGGTHGVSADMLNGGGGGGGGWYGGSGGGATSGDVNNRSGGGGGSGYCASTITNCGGDTGGNTTLGNGKAYIYWGQ